MDAQQLQHPSPVFVDYDSALMGACFTQSTKNELVQLVRRNARQASQLVQCIAFCRDPVT